MDRPRFKRVEGPHDVLHRRYHGGGVVEAVFCLVDAWYQGRLQLWRRSPAPNDRFLKLRFASELPTLNAGRDGPA
ncbi:MAG TPA: hypothetical protein VFR19_07810 [Hyphomicrobiaceae bacterium]|nr:hypothetical protein [Hyphomicrobiaceae bacterium]